MADGDSAASGGLLVVLGIIVAVGLGIVFFGGFMHQSSGPEIKVELPKVITK